MVLAEWGNSIADALSNLTRSSTVDQTDFNKLLNAITKSLMSADVEFALTVQVQKNIKAKVDIEKLSGNINNLKRVIHATVVQELVNLLESKSKPYELQKGKTNVVMFVGLQGAGKTTTVTKYASYYQRKGWKTGLICADTYRAGAFDQLKQNATKAKIPYYGSYSEVDPVVVAQEGVKLFKKEKYDLIIIDTSGRHKQENALFEEMEDVARVTKPDDIVFVMDGSIGKSAKDQATAFKSAVSVGSVIITKLDGHAKGGGALSAVAATNSPISFIGTGEHINQFEPFDARSFVSRLLGMADVSGLMNMIKDTNIIDEQTELMKKMHAGKSFSLKDMYGQLKTIMKMGSFSQIMGMLPKGMVPDSVSGPEAEKEQVRQMRGMMAILDSMTTKELDSDGKIFQEQPSRIDRVARGSGRPKENVNMLLSMYQTMSGMMNSMGNMTKHTQNLGFDPSKLFKNGKFIGTPQQAAEMKKAANSMRAGGFDPQALMKGMGGGGGGMPDMSQMMSQMMGGGGGGMPDMGAMMSQLMGGGGGGMADMMKQMMGGMGGGGGGMPDMSQMMSQMMGGGGGGMPDMGAMMSQLMGGGGGGMADMMKQMMGGMGGMGGMGSPPPRR